MNVGQAKKAVVAARKALAALAAAGKDPRSDSEVNSRRGAAISESHRQNREWARSHPGQQEKAWFKREIAPNLDGFSLKELADATGLSAAACSRIRAGTRVPHPRHWNALKRLGRR